MEPRIILNNQTVLKIQDRLEPLPPLSLVITASSRPGGSTRDLAGSQTAEILNQAKNDLAEAGGEPVSAQLAILEPSHSGARHLVPVWSCLFRYKSDPLGFERLITSPMTPSALELPHFQLGSRTRPDQIAVHQPAPKATLPCVRLFARFCEFFETQDSWPLSRFDSDWTVLGGEYFEMRVFPGNKMSRDGEEIFAGAWTFCSRLREELRDEIGGWPVEKLPLTASLLKRISNAEPSLRTIKDLSELSPTELKDRMPQKKVARSELVDIQSALRLYGLALAEDEA